VEKVEIGDYVAYLFACVVFHAGKVSPASRTFAGILYIGMGGIQCLQKSLIDPIWHAVPLLTAAFMSLQFGKLLVDTRGLLRQIPVNALLWRSSSGRICTPFVYVLTHKIDLISKVLTA